MNAKAQTKAKAAPKTAVLKGEALIESYRWLFDAFKPHAPKVRPILMSEESSLVLKVAWDDGEQPQFSMWSLHYDVVCHGKVLTKFSMNKLVEDGFLTREGIIKEMLRCKPR